MTHETALLELPAKELLTEFGSAKAAPGSGCAAALMGLLAANLILSVVGLSLKKGPNPTGRSQLEYLQERATTAKRELQRLFEKDAELFAPVIETRRARDKETDKARKIALGLKASKQLKAANDIVMEIASVCEGLYRDAIDTYRIGYRAVSGEAGAAISACVAAVSTCLFVVNLNARTGKNRWTTSAGTEAVRLHNALVKMQAEALQFVIESRNQTVRALELPFSEELP